MRRIRLLPLLGMMIVLLPAAAKDGLPLVGLNHLTLVPDSATFAAIASSSFLRDTFALVDRSADGGAERIALFGRSTYVEFRRPAGATIARTSGLALGTDERGALRTIAKRLTSEVGPLHLDSVSRRRDSADVPWLYELAVSEARTDSALDLRVVEYHPQFVRRWFGVATSATSVARADVLAMHASVVSSARRFPFIDIVAIKIAASTESAARLVAHCRGVGWRVQAASGGTACVGPGVRVFVVPSGEQHGIVAFTMRIAPSVRVRGSGARTFGRSTLKVSKTGLATWEFSGNSRP